MTCNRVRITLTFAADLDPVPGWGHQPEDWVRLVRSQLVQHAHYRTEIEITEVKIVEPPAEPVPEEGD